MFKKVLSLSLAATLLTSGQLMAQKTDSLSYALGVLFGSNLKQMGIDQIDTKTLNEALLATVAGQPTMLDVNQAQQVLNSKVGALQAKKGQAVRTAGEKFLATNKTRPGVITTASGLQYEIIKAGTGAIPKANNTVRCHYRGVLTTGEQFDSSYDRNQPADFPVTGVIQGWIEALQLMPTGSKWKLYIPYNLAYGERGQPQANIPGYSVLIFDIELLEIVK